MTILISLEGNIGSGKSRLLDHLRTNLNLQGLKVCFLLEPVEEWNGIVDASGKTILQNYYDDQRRYAFTFQMMAYISRLALLRKSLREGYDIIFTERSIYTDSNVFALMLFHDGKITKMEHDIYSRWSAEFINDLPKIYYLHINVLPELAQERIQRRSREGEIISLDYLRNCQRYHDNWLIHVPAHEILHLNGNGNVDENPQIYETWTDEIKYFILFVYNSSSTCNSETVSISSDQ